MKQIFPGRKDSIILAAIEIISDSGIQNLSTKEIAKRQGITESLLYRYFKSKEEIVIATLEYSSRFDKVIKNTIRKSKFTGKGRITEYIRMYMEYYENYPVITAILFSYHQFLRNQNTSEMVREILNKRHSFLLELVIQCQNNGEIGDEFAPEEITNIVLGFIWQIIIKWSMDGFSFSLKDNALSTLEKILRNF